MGIRGRCAPVVVAVVVLLAGCGAASRDAAPPSPPSPARTIVPAAALDAPAFADCAEFLRYVRDEAEPGITPWGGRYQPRPDYVLSSGGLDAGPPDRVAGADEPVAAGPPRAGDLVAPAAAVADGGLVVSRLDGAPDLRVDDADADPPAARGRVRIPDYDHGMLLVAPHRVLVLGTRYAVPTGPRTERVEELLLTLVDLADPDRPTVIREEALTGHYVTAGMRDGVVRVAFTTEPRLHYETAGEHDASDPVLARNRARLRASRASDWLPLRRVVVGPGAGADPTPALGCADVRRPAVPAGLGILGVLTLDTAKGPGALHTAQVAAVAGSGELVHLGADRVYVGTVDGGWDPRPPPEGPGTGTGDPPAVPRTELHAFDASATGSAYRGTGSVSGYVPSRWGIDGAGGRLRVVTTTVGPWLPGATCRTGIPGGSGCSVPPARTALVTLSGDGAPVETGRTEDLTPGFDLRAVRWFGDLAAVVTTHQGDRVRLVDLADPDHPRPGGELEVTGFSALLHPLGPRLVLALSDDAAGGAPGVALFDATRADRPKRVATMATGTPVRDRGASSMLTVLPDRGIAVLGAFLRTHVTCPPVPWCGGSNAVPAPAPQIAGPDGSTPFPAPSPVPGPPEGDVDLPGHLAIDLANGTLRETGRNTDTHASFLVPVRDLVAAVTQDGIVLLDPRTLRPTRPAS